MNPEQLAKSDTEHAHQTALFAYAAVAHRHGFEVADAWAFDGEILKDAIEEYTNYPVNALEWFHAIPNGGSRGDDAKSRKIRGAQLKAEGVRQGVADTFLPWPVAHWHGLYIEMKKPSQRPKTEGHPTSGKYKPKGGMSDEQIKFKEYALNVGFGFMTCYSWQEAVETLKAYIKYQSKE